MDCCIAICTRNRAAMLEQTLRAVAELRTPSGCDWECLVVDNGSSDATRSVVEDSARAHDRVRYVHEDVCGLSVARNRAIRETQAGIIIFIDDDAVPDSELLVAYRDAYETADDDVAEIGGKIDLCLPDGPKPPWFGPMLMGYLTQFDLAGEGVRECPADVLPYGANMSFRRAVLDAMGGFRKDLGYAGRGLTPGEETDLGDRLRWAGYRILYQPRAIVTHHIPGERIRSAYFAGRARGNGVAYALRRNPTGSRRAALGTMLRCGRALALNIARLAAAVLGGCPVLYAHYLHVLANWSAIKASTNQVAWGTRRR